MRIEKNNLIPENTPHSIAAGIIYFISDICNLNINKKKGWFYYIYQSHIF